MNKDKIYTNIRADIKNSREGNTYTLMPSYYDAVKKEIQCRRLEDNPNLNLQIRNGDELFGIYESLEVAFSVTEILFVKAKELNIEIHLGIGIGKLAIIDSNIHQINGSAIWNATEALELEKKKRNSNSFSHKKIKSDFQQSYDDVMNYIYNSAVENIKTRTLDQQRAITLRQRFPEEAAENLYMMLYPEADASNTVNNAHNYRRFLTRGKLIEYEEAIRCIINLCKELEGKSC